MTPTRPRVEPDGYYSVTQAAEALGVERHTIRRYVKQGLLTMQVRKSTCRPVVSGRQIIRFWERMY